MYDISKVEKDNTGFCPIWLSTSILKNIISNIGSDIEIHANLQTIVSTYINRIKYDERFTNLMLMCEKEEMLPILSEMYDGAFDVKNKIFWFNRYKPINIIVDDNVCNGYTLLIKDGEVLGYIQVN